MNKIHLIGNAHLDPVWLWRWQEGFSEVIATFRSALDRMKEFPNFKFTSACSVYYELIEKIDPVMFSEIRERVREGRWSIVGGMFLQPDCNLPDGESFARHLLISQRYFEDKLGVKAKTGYNVDSFGHNASLPKILRAGGIENYVFMRPSPEEQGRDESLFIWQADDGSRVRSYRIPYRYCINSHTLDLLPKLEEKADAEKTDLMAFYGVGNHGGGPTVKLINEINGIGLKNAVYSTPDEYFDSVNGADLPIIEGELQHHARGCYSAMSAVKRGNRRCEQNLLMAERLSVMANKLAGLKYPAKKLKKAWKNLLFNQFHDILGGCSIKSAYDDAAHLFGETMSITEQAMYFAMQSIAHNIDTLKGEIIPAYKESKNWKIWEHERLGTPIVVFNPHGHKVRGIVAVNQNATMITDHDGREVDIQRVRGEQTNRASDIYHTAFIAEVPALGYAVYRLFSEKASGASSESELTVTERSLENALIKVEFDADTGDICKIYDKRSGKAIINSPCRAILLDESECDTWAHNKKYLGDEVASFGAPSFKIIESGAVRATIRVTTTAESSTLVRDYSVMQGDATVTVKVKADFREKHRTLKFAFPMADQTVIAKTAYGSVKRVGYTGEEPCGSWIACGGIAVANDSKYGYDTLGGEMRLTVLRGAIYADHFGVRDDLCEYMDQGIHEFSYRIFPYECASSAERTASELNFKLPFIMESFHCGTLPEVFSSFDADGCSSAILTAVKERYNGSGIVARFYEADGKDAELSFKLFGKEIKAHLEKNAIITLSESGEVLDLLENEKK